MEFLVRLSDKINTRVHCINPKHAGLLNGRVAFEDPTFKAVCPECHEVDWLVRKNNLITKKGHFITYKPDGWTWGKNERKHFGIARIDCTEAEASEWCASTGDNNPDDPTAMVLFRPRKYAMGIDKVVDVEELKLWNDDGVYSPTKFLSTVDLFHIREVTDAIVTR